ncbi:MAG: putative F420-dependent oxidoreductase [Candidatus Poriferisodalaceae bacterium]|jgi:probable F420-dependent oxidoreductase
MKVGINLINFGPSARPDVLLGWVELTERLGYHSLLTSDHLAITPDVSANYPAPFYEPLSMLGWLAGVTTNIQIGTTVTIVPYRNPLELARSYANIDQLSGGRLIFGVGVGWAQQEFAALDVPYHRRGAMTDDYLDVITKHWTEPLLSHDSQFLTCVDVDTAPRPLQEPVPIWVGGSSDAALRRTVKFDANWHPIRLRPTWLRDKGLPRLAAEAERAGKPTPPVCPRIMFHLTDQPVDEAERFMGHGTLEQVHGDLHLLESLGCEHVILDAYSPFADIPIRDAVTDPAGGYRSAWDSYELVAAEVLDLAGETVR